MVTVHQTYTSNQWRQLDFIRVTNLYGHKSIDLVYTIGLYNIQSSQKIHFVNKCLIFIIHFQCMCRRNVHEYVCVVDIRVYGNQCYIMYLYQQYTIKTIYENGSLEWLLKHTFPRLCLVCSILSIMQKMHKKTISKHILIYPVIILMAAILIPLHNQNEYTRHIPNKGTI